MASILRVNTITDASSNNSTATSTVFSGTAKAFCRADNAAGLRNTFNIASGTDNGTGNYTYTFTNNMSSNFTSGTAVAITNGARMSTYSNVQTSRYDTDTHNESGTDTDAATATNTFGDLA